jgi:hypothetical protein
LIKGLAEKKGIENQAVLSLLFTIPPLFLSLKQTVMNHKELEKSKVYVISRIVEYISNSVVSRTILMMKKDCRKKSLLLILLYRLSRVKQKSL